MNLFHWWLYGQSVMNLHRTLNWSFPMTSVTTYCRFFTKSLSFQDLKFMPHFLASVTASSLLSKRFLFFPKASFL